MPIAICFMKLIVDLAIETMSLILTASYNSVSDIIMNFISMNCISSLDNMYYLSIHSPLKNELKTTKFKIEMES